MKLHQTRLFGKPNDVQHFNSLWLSNSLWFQDLSQFSIICIKKLSVLFHFFLFQSTHARACWAWCRVWSQTTRSLHPPILTETGYQKTPACWRAEQGGLWCHSHSPSQMNGCRWILVRRNWWGGWSSRVGNIETTRSSWRSFVSATAKTTLTGGWWMTPMGTSQR